MSWEPRDRFHSLAFWLRVDCYPCSIAIPLTSPGKSIHMFLRYRALHGPGTVYRCEKWVSIWQCLLGEITAKGIGASPWEVFIFCLNIPSWMLLHETHTKYFRRTRHALPNVRPLVLMYYFTKFTSHFKHMLIALIFTLSELVRRSSIWI